MKAIGFICGVALTMSAGAQAQGRPSKEEARKQQEQARLQRQQERAQRDAFVAELVRAEQDSSLAETAGTDRIPFAVGDAVLSKDAELVLIRTVHWLRLHPDSILQIQERCSEAPTHNRAALAKRRTQRVADFLVAYSTGAQRVRQLAPATAISSGETACAVFLTTKP